MNGLLHDCQLLCSVALLLNALFKEVCSKRNAMAQSHDPGSTRVQQQRATHYNTVAKPYTYIHISMTFV